MNWLPGSAAEVMDMALLCERLYVKYEELCLPVFNVAQWHFPDEALLLFFLMSLVGHCAEDIWCDAIHMSFCGSNWACRYWPHSFKGTGLFSGVKMSSCMNMPEKTNAKTANSRYLITLFISFAKITKIAERTLHLPAILIYL